MTRSSGTCSPSPPSDNGKVIKFIGWLIRGGMQVEMSKYTEGIGDKLMRPDELPVSLIHYDDWQYDDVVDNGGGAEGEGPARVLAGGGAHGAPAARYTAARPRRGPGAAGLKGIEIDNIILIFFIWTYQFRRCAPLLSALILLVMF